MAAGFIAGDWGLSHLRLWLCDGAGRVRDTRHGVGISAAKGACQAILCEAIAGWDDGPIVLCGMVGSAMGWMDVPYVAAPASASDIAAATVSFAFGQRRVTIVPGVRAPSAFDAPDVMRGEETQIIGAMRQCPGLRHGAHQVCLPGTHTKWVELRDGRIETITTSVSGELFALLCNHGTLAEGAGVWDGAVNDAFRLGLSRRTVPLLSALFEARARRLAGDLAPGDVHAFLSGAIIGHDVVLAACGPVVVVATASLAALYAEALAGRGVAMECLDGEACARAGLTVIHGG